MAREATDPQLSRREDYFFTKFPLTVRLDTDEQFTIRVDDPATARLMYTDGAGEPGIQFGDHPASITLAACGEPVGYAGGFAVTEPTCVRVTVVSSIGISSGAVPVGAPCQ